jgi:rare lipoprotein A
VILFLSIALAARLLAHPAPPVTLPQRGLATWYSAPAGARTASGERFDPRRLTAAHRTLPFGTCVAVTRRDTGRTVRVRVTDRGPFAAADRVIDLSPAAADRLGMARAGVVEVRLRKARRCPR